VSNGKLYITIVGEPRSGKSAALAVILNALRKNGANARLADNKITRTNTELVGVKTAQYDRLQGKSVEVRVSEFDKEGHVRT